MNKPLLFFILLFSLNHLNAAQAPAPNADKLAQHNQPAKSAESATLRKRRAIYNAAMKHIKQHKIPHYNDLGRGGECYKLHDNGDLTMIGYWQTEGLSYWEEKRFQNPDRKVDFLECIFNCLCCIEFTQEL